VGFLGYKLVFAYMDTAPLDHVFAMRSPAEHQFPLKLELVGVHT